MDILAKILEIHSKNEKLVNIVCEVMKDLEDYYAHRNLKNYAIKCDVFETPEFIEYFKKFDEYMYHITMDEEKIWCIPGTIVLHREHLPARILADGSQCWYDHGQIHRVEKGTDPNDAMNYGRTLPAEIWADGSVCWKQFDEFHCDDFIMLFGQKSTLPAASYADGTCMWYKRGVLHREDTDGNGNVLPAIIRADGAMEWYYNGEKFEQYTLSKKLKNDYEVAEMCKDFLMVNR
jgi:hypothetical protein